MPRKKRFTRSRDSVTARAISEVFDDLLAPTCAYVYLIKRSERHFLIKLYSRKSDVCSHASYDKTVLVTSISPSSNMPRTWKLFDYNTSHASKLVLPTGTTKPYVSVPCLRYKRSKGFLAYITWMILIPHGDATSASRPMR